MGLGNIGSSKTQEAMQEVKASNIQKQAVQEDATSPLTEDWRDNINTFVKKQIRKKTLKTRSSSTKKAEFSKEKAERTHSLEQLRKTADQFESRNQELKSRVLVLLREYIKPGDTAEEILKKVQEFYEDPSLADEALEYLLETTEGELHQKVVEAKTTLNQQFGREILAGRNIGQAAREGAKEGLGTPTSLRDLYRDITGNPRDSTTLFSELSKQYQYKQLQKVIGFLLHSVGTDLKAKGSSIPRGLLHNLLQETRTLQSILGVYSFFRGRMDLIKSMFAKNGLPLPAELTFESLAKQFMVLVNDRYPSSDKVLQTASRLGIDKWILAKIIAFSQLRDAIREVAMGQIYRSLQHRDDLYDALIAALEALEEELEELLDEEYEGESENEEEDNEFEEDEDF